MAKDDRDIKQVEEESKQDEELVFDTSKMTAGQKEAMEVAESARENFSWEISIMTW